MMIRRNFTYILLGAGLMAAVAFPCAYAGIFDSAKNGKPITFTTFTQAQSSLMQQVPCKWMSKKSFHSDRNKYDFLCTGGNWATVNLMFDKGKGDDLKKVRLLWRSWDPKVHPAAGEGQQAARFLEFILHNFVPQKHAKSVQQAFWGNKKSTWRGKYVIVKYSYEPKQGYSLHKLEVIGTGKQVESLQPKPVIEVKKQPKDNKTRKTVSIDSLRKPEADVLSSYSNDYIPRSAVKPENAYKATVYVRMGEIEINALSRGKRTIDVLTLPEDKRKQYLVSKPIKNISSQFGVTPPPVKTGTYAEAETLTKSYTKDAMNADKMRKPVGPLEGFSSGTGMTTTPFEGSQSAIPPAKPLMPIENPNSDAEKIPQKYKYEDEKQAL